jgi:peptide/nickel transport system substrate-binding protein
MAQHGTEENGELDAAYSVNVEDISRYETDPNYTVLTSPSGRTTFGFLNQNEGRIFADETLRQAVTRMADRETYCHCLFYDQFVPGKTPLTSSLPYGYNERNDINAYSIESAQKLLDDAGRGADHGTVGKDVRHRAIR